jgi:hypothetical protein
MGTDGPLKKKDRRLALRRELSEIPRVQAANGPTSPMARQMAKLLASSDVEELREVIARWLAEAPTERVRQQYQRFGAKMLELKQALAAAPQQPSEEELELALTMMLKLAAQAGPDSGAAR